MEIRRQPLPIGAGPDFEEEEEDVMLAIHDDTRSTTARCRRGLEEETIVGGGLRWVVAEETGGAVGVATELQKQ